MLKRKQRKMGDIKLNEGTDDPGKVCYGCAHSASTVPFPGRPSGERPCCFCVRNPEREDWIKKAGESTERHLVPDSEGTLRDMNPFAGNWYNGSPAIKVPMDCYHSLDYAKQTEFWEKHPEYAKPIRFDSDGNMIVVEKDG